MANLVIEAGEALGKGILDPIEKINPIEKSVQSTADLANEAVMNQAHHLPVIGKILDMQDEAVAKVREGLGDVEKLETDTTRTPSQKFRDVLTKNQSKFQRKFDLDVKDGTYQLKPKMIDQGYFPNVQEKADIEKLADSHIKLNDIHNKFNDLKSTGKLTDETHKDLAKQAKGIIEGDGSPGSEPLHETQIRHEKRFNRHYKPEHEDLAEEARFDGLRVNNRVHLMKELDAAIGRSDLTAGQKTKLRGRLTQSGGKASTFKIFDDGKIRWKGADTVSGQTKEQFIGDMTKVIKTQLPELADTMLTNGGIGIQKVGFLSETEHFPVTKQFNIRSLLSDNPETEIGDNTDIERKIQHLNTRFVGEGKLYDTPVVPLDLPETEAEFEADPEFKIPKEGKGKEPESDETIPEKKNISRIIKSKMDPEIDEPALGEPTDEPTDEPGRTVTSAGEGKPLPRDILGDGPQEGSGPGDFPDTPPNGDLPPNGPGLGEKLKEGAKSLGGKAVEKLAPAGVAALSVAAGSVATFGLVKLEESIDDSDLNPLLKTVLKENLDILKNSLDTFTKGGRKQLKQEIDKIGKDILNLGQLEKAKGEIINLVNNPGPNVSRNKSNRRELNEVEDAIRNQKAEIEKDARRLKRDTQTASVLGAKAKAKKASMKRAKASKDKALQRALENGQVSQAPPIPPGGYRPVNINISNDTSTGKKTIDESTNSATKNVTEDPGDDTLAAGGGKKLGRVTKDLLK